MVEGLCCSPTSVMPPDFTQEKRSVRIHGRSTTVRLERMFWRMLEDVARRAEMSLPRLIERLHDCTSHFGASNLASCCRVVCLKLCQGAISVDDLAGRHGPQAVRAARA